MRMEWTRAVLLLTIGGYLTALVALAPSNNPAIPLLALVPLVVAGGLFGLRVAVPVMIGLIVATGLAIELIGPGIAAVFETYQGIPLLMFIMIGVVVGRLHDVNAKRGRELEQRRQVEIQLNDTKQRLEALLEAKEQLITSIGHELRTPLTAVLGFAELLRIGTHDEMEPGDRAEMVDFIAREAFELSGIIDNLLVAARIEIGKLEVSTVTTSLRAQVAQVIEGWDPKTATRVKVSGGNGTAIADPARVRHILRNLISNALLYGGDQVTVTVGTDSARACVDVCDDGPRLPQGESERIFEPYYRYHSEATQPGSLGLGLTVARGLAELMEGTITYRHHNHNNIFTFQLPLAGTHPRQKAADQDMAGSGMGLLMVSPCASRSDHCHDSKADEISASHVE